MHQSFTIPGTLPALNAMIGSAKAHWSVYRRERQGAVRKVRLFIRQARLKPVPPGMRVEIHTTFYAPNKRTDPSNLSAGLHKVAEDCLQAEGILINDGYNQIAGYVERFEVDRENPRIEVEIKNTTESK